MPITTFIAWMVSERRMFERVLLCYDGSEAGRRALKRGAELVIRLKAQLFVLSIIPEGVVDSVIVASAAGHACLADERADHRKLLDESIEWLKTRGILARGYSASGNTIDQILAHTKQLAIDLLVLGHYPQPSGGNSWSHAQRAPLAERANCCIFVAVTTADDL